MGITIPIPTTESKLWSFVWQAILPAGGLSGRRSRCAANFLGIQRLPWLKAKLKKVS
jgi:hypothetical protein